MILLLILFNVGLNLYFPKNSKACLAGRELLYFFGIMCIVAFASDAIQYTPFPPIDRYILALETKLHINLLSLVEWTNQYPHFKFFLSVVYDSLPYQMSVIPLIIIFSCRFHLIREYYFLLLCTTLIGFLFYYFFPTIAPAGTIASPLFSENQLATSLKFNQIHNYINPTTTEGGLIAMPSFHTIWALMCVMLLREWKILCFILAIINGFLIASCVLLGWHYPIDIAGGFLVLIMSWSLLQHCTKT